MDEIDYIMEQLETNIPDDAYDYEEFDIEEMLESNKLIRDRIREISVIVSAAITKAAILKKTVNTHRDPPTNSVVKEKLKQIKKYQTDIEKCKNYIKQLRARIDSVQDAGRGERANNSITKLDKESAEMRNHKVELNKQLFNQILTIKKLYSDPDYKDKVTGLHDEIKKTKERWEELREEKKKVKVKQSEVINKMADLDLAVRSLKDKKASIQNGIKPTELVEDLSAETEYEQLRKRNEAYDKAVTNNQIKMIDKVLAKESRFVQLLS